MGGCFSMDFHRMQKLDKLTGFQTFVMNIMYFAKFDSTNRTIQLRESYKIEKAICCWMLKMLLTIFGLLRSVRVTCNSRTVFSLHLHKQIASQKEWTEILNLHFFQFIRSANRKIWLHHIFTIATTYILVKTVTTVVTTTVFDSTICVYTSVVPVNMLQVNTLRCYYWSWYMARRGRQQISTTTTKAIYCFVMSALLDLN